MLDALQLSFQRAGVERIAQAYLQPLDADRFHDKILRAGAHRRHHIVDAAMGGLHHHRDGKTGFADFGQHAHAVEAGHHQIKHQGIDRGRVRRGQQRNGGVTGVDDGCLIAAFLHHILDQAACDSVVVGDQNAGSHGVPRTLLLSVSNRGTLADAD